MCVLQRGYAALAVTEVQPAPAHTAVHCTPLRHYTETCTRCMTMDKAPTTSLTDLDDADDRLYGIFSVKPLRPTGFTTLLNIPYMSATRALHFGGRVARHNQRNDSRQPQQHHAAASHPLLARPWLPPTLCYIALQHASGRALAHIMGPQPGAGVSRCWPLLPGMRRRVCQCSASCGARPRLPGLACPAICRPRDKQYDAAITHMMPSK